MIKFNYLLFILLLLVSLIYFKNRFSSFTVDGHTVSYAPDDAEYIEPEIYPNIISPEEGEYILEKAIPQFSDSVILSGSSDSIRKSKTAWLYKDDPVVHQIYERLAHKFHFDIDNAEALQVVKYEPKGFYVQHHDSCCDDNQSCIDFSRTSGQRILTILIYLNDDFTGGTTEFPILGKHFKAPKYGALVFHPLAKDSNQCHRKALHKGVEVESGTKYICNIWVREHKF
jgi:prolyl 4-hydroxylase